MSSRSFKGKPIHGHLVQGTHGLSGEILDVRNDIDTAFKSLEAEFDTPGPTVGTTILVRSAPLVLKAKDGVSSDAANFFQAANHKP